jgi:hypothetical protein
MLENKDLHINSTQRVWPKLIFVNNYNEYGIRNQIVTNDWVIALTVCRTVVHLLLSLALEDKLSVLNWPTSALQWSTFNTLTCNRTGYHRTLAYNRVGYHLTLSHTTQRVTTIPSHIQLNRRPQCPLTYNRTGDHHTLSHTCKRAGDRHTISHTNKQTTQYPLTYSRTVDHRTLPHPNERATTVPFLMGHHHTLSQTLRNLHLHYPEVCVCVCVDIVTLNILFINGFNVTTSF